MHSKILFITFHKKLLLNSAVTLLKLIFTRLIVGITYTRGDAFELQSTLEDSDPLTNTQKSLKSTVDEPSEYIKGPRDTFGSRNSNPYTGFDNDANESSE